MSVYSTRSKSSPKISTPFSPKMNCLRDSTECQTRNYTGEFQKPVSEISKGVGKGKSTSNIFANCRVCRGWAKPPVKGGKIQTPFWFTAMYSGCLQALLRCSTLRIFMLFLIICWLQFRWGCSRVVLKWGCDIWRQTFTSRALGVLRGCFEVPENFRH